MLSCFHQPGCRYDQPTSSLPMPARDRFDHARLTTGLEGTFEQLTLPYRNDCPNAL